MAVDLKADNYALVRAMFTAFDQVYGTVQKSYGPASEFFLRQRWRLNETANRLSPFGTSA